jgi:hypothetical protein
MIPGKADLRAPGCFRNAVGQVIEMKDFALALVPVLGTALIAFLAAWSGIRNYRKQKAIDREVELRNIKAKAYERYLATYFDLERVWGTEEFEQATLKYSQAHHRLFQVASDDVLLSVAKLHQHVWATPTSQEGWLDTWKDLYATMLLDMRQDAAEATNIPKEQIIEFLPWSFGEFQKASEEAVQTRQVISDQEKSEADPT